MYLELDALLLHAVLYTYTILHAMLSLKPPSTWAHIQRKKAIIIICLLMVIPVNKCKGFGISPHSKANKLASYSRGHKTPGPETTTLLHIAIAIVKVSRISAVSCPGSKVPTPTE